jgi:O-antigen ligase
MLGFATGSVTLSVLYSFGIGVGYDEDGRVSIFGTNQNEVGILMSISAIYIILMLLQNRGSFGKFRFLYLAGLPFVLSLMLATGSRTAFIALLMAFIAIIALYKTQSGWVKTALVLAGIAGLVGLWQYLMNSELVAQRLLETLEDGDLSERDTIWKAVLPVWLSSPFFGVGNTGYEFFCSWYYGRIMSPHNVLIEILILSGMTGLSIYLYFFYRVFRISWKTYRTLGYLVPMLLLLPVTGMLLSGQLLYIKSGWIIFAYITSNAIYLSSPKKASAELYSEADGEQNGMTIVPLNRSGK